MNKKFLIIILIAIAAVTVYYFGLSREAKEEPAEQSQLANPAAVYCLEQGGAEENIMFEDGVRTYCVFNDGSKCWQWDFYRGDCQKGDLKIETLTEGTREPANVGDTVVVHYVGTLEDETQFDSSLDKDAPLSFTLGKGDVIAGWEYGVLGMKLGEKRRLTLGPSLAYGTAGVPGFIPPNAVIVFEIVLLGIQ